MKIHKEISFWTIVFSSVASAVPLINLIRNRNEITLFQEFEEFLAKYQEVLANLAANILFWTDARPSQEYLDAYALSLIASFILLRSGYSSALKHPEGYDTGAFTLIAGGIMMALMSLTLITLLYYPFAVVMMVIYIKNRKTKPEGELTTFGRYIMTSLLSLILATLSFFFTSHLLMIIQ